MIWEDIGIMNIKGMFEMSIPNIFQARQKWGASVSAMVSFPISIRFVSGGNGGLIQSRRVRHR
jgi:hypothetical protein